MRRKHKIFYDIQDWSPNFPHLWWNNGDWRLINEGKLDGRCCSNRTVFSLKTATKTAKRLESKGGVALISRFYYRKGVRYVYDFYLSKESREKGVTLD